MEYVGEHIRTGYAPEKRVLLLSLASVNLHLSQLFAEYLAHIALGQFRSKFYHGGEFVLGQLGGAEIDYFLFRGRFALF